MVQPVYSTAAQGLQNAQRSFLKHTGGVARSADPDGPGLQPGDVAGLLVSRRGYAANLAVLARADRMVGSLIDVLA